MEARAREARAAREIRAFPEDGADALRADVNQVSPHFAAMVAFVSLLTVISAWGPTRTLPIAPAYVAQRARAPPYMLWPLRRQSASYGKGQSVRPGMPRGVPNAEVAAAAAAAKDAFSAGVPPPLPTRKRLAGVARRRDSKRRFEIRTTQAINTLIRVALPTAVASILGLLYFDNVSLYIRSLLDVGAIGMLMADEAQFIQNFLTVIGLLFSILAGNAYSALYEQQEAIYFALFQEVSEAKSLLEQTTLVCQGRPFYQAALHYIRLYVRSSAHAAPALHPLRPSGAELRAEGSRAGCTLEG